MANAIQWMWSEEYKNHWYTDSDGNTHWMNVVARTAPAAEAPRTVPPFAYNSQHIGYSQSPQQLQYHQTQRQYHETQEQYHQLLDQYYQAQPYISLEQLPQYYREQWQHHSQQLQYHQQQASYFPDEAQSHQQRAEFHQGQVQGYGQLMQAALLPRTPQQLAESHRQQADYHHQLARNHQPQSPPGMTHTLSSYQSPDSPPYPSGPNLSSSAATLSPSSVPMSRNYTHTSSGSMDLAQPRRPVARIEGTPGEKDVLDPAYVVQKKPRKYFVFGRVFLVLWTEPTSGPGFGTEYTQVRFGQFVYSDIRRFVVVREGADSCWCLPIHSYRKRATTKRATIPDDHAIIYTTHSPPEPMEGEWLNKKPLQVEVESPDLKLDSTSRINFGKIYTVEHNIKVKRLGMIAQGSMHLLSAYYGGSDGRQT